MTARLDQILVGILTALATPVLLTPRHLRRLLAPSAASTSPPADLPRDALNAALLTLRCLERVPLRHSPWRNTCLFRAAAACVILRRRGHPAVLRLGVRRGTPDSAHSGRVEAHAWIAVREQGYGVDGSGFTRLELSR